MELFLDPTDGFAESYAVELLYETVPELDAELLERRLRRHLPAVETFSRSQRTTGDGEPSGFTLTARHPIDADWPSPAWRIGAPERELEAGRIAAAARQTWWWEEGRQSVARSCHRITLADRDAATLPYRNRLELFQRTLVAVLEAHPAVALHWLPSQQLVDPDELIATALTDGYSNPLPGAVNVRFFRIESSREGEMLMDTLGLVALGLPDLQCHFRGLDPNDVSRVLYTTACYLYDHGPVVENGHSVAGPGKEDRWTCRLENAIAEPRRPVLDLDPGFPFAGGESEEDYVLPGGS